MLYMTNERYESARKIYQSIGVDTEAALDRLKECAGINALLAGR